MVFWICLALIAVAVVWVFVEFFREGDTEMAVVGAVICAVIGIVISAVVILALTLIPALHAHGETYKLRALGTSEKMQGQFFLGSGYVDGVRTLNYIKQETDGGVTYSQLGSADGEASRIFEDSDSPTVIEYQWFYANGWVIPWNVNYGHSWSFHIPKGSILEGYSINN